MKLWDDCLFICVIIWLGKKFLFTIIFICFVNHHTNILDSFDLKSQNHLLARCSDALNSLELPIMANFLELFGIEETQM